MTRKIGKQLLYDIVLLIVLLSLCVSLYLFYVRLNSFKERTTEISFYDPRIFTPQYVDGEKIDSAFLFVQADFETNLVSYFSHSETIDSLVMEFGKPLELYYVGSESDTPLMANSGEYYDNGSLPREFYLNYIDLMSVLREDSEIYMVAVYETKMFEKISTGFNSSIGLSLYIPSDNVIFEIVNLENAAINYVYPEPDYMDSGKIMYHTDPDMGFYNHIDIRGINKERQTKNQNLMFLIGIILGTLFTFIINILLGFRQSVSKPVMNRNKYKQYFSHKR